jgi:hypothetical protein
MAMTPEQKATAAEREKVMFAAVAKHLKIKPEDVLSVGFVREMPDGELNYYSVMVADRPKKGPMRGKRHFIKAELIGKGDDLVKQVASAERSG